MHLIIMSQYTKMPTAKPGAVSIAPSLTSDHAREDEERAIAERLAERLREIQAKLRCEATTAVTVIEKRAEFVTSRTNDNESSRLGGDVSALALRRRLEGHLNRVGKSHSPKIVAGAGDLVPKHANQQVAPSSSLEVPQNLGWTEYDQAMTRHGSPQHRQQSHTMDRRPGRSTATHSDGLLAGLAISEDISDCDLGTESRGNLERRRADVGGKKVSSLYDTKQTTKSKTGPQGDDSEILIFGEMSPVL
jgi:hypothetical protein